jgi:hypothetical protein
LSRIKRGLGTIDLLAVPEELVTPIFLNRLADPGFESFQLMSAIRSEDDYACFGD